MINNFLLKKYIKENICSFEYFNIKKICCGMSWDSYLIELEHKKLVMKVAIHKDPIILKRMNIQYNIQEYLFNTFPVAQPLSYSYDDSIAGTPFYILKYVDGKNKYDNKSIIKSYELLSELHNMSLNIYSNKVIDNYLEICIKKSFNQYNLFKNNTDICIESVIEFLLRNIPKEKMFSFTHNDWKQDNIFFIDNKINAVLDWELFEIGDPRLDLATSISWLPKNKFKYKNIFIESYLNKSKFNCSSNDLIFFEILAKLKIMVFLQAARIKYESGIIKNNRFKSASDIIKLTQQELLNYVK